MHKPRDLSKTVAGQSVAVPTTQGIRPYINFDNAASTPAFVRVARLVQGYMPWYASVHRGNGFKSRLSTELYEQARHCVGEFVGANAVEHVVIFGKNTTEAINKLSFRLSLNKKDIVLIGHLEHHSNDLPWRARATIKRIAITADGALNITHYQRLLDKYAGRVKLVAISGASNVTGCTPDIHQFAWQAHAAGAQIFVDCAQLAAHRPIAIKSLNDPEHLDYIALSAHKMYAPFGSGALVGRRDTFERGQPEYAGGGTVDFVTTKTVDWAPPPDSDEAGSPNVIGALAMARAARTLQHIGFARIVRHEAQLLEYALQQLRAVPGIIIYGPLATARTGVIPFTMANVPAQKVAAILGYEWGIGVRAGCFCAHPYVMSLLGLNKAAIQGVRDNILHQHRDRAPGMVRVSFGLYNTMAEVDVLVRALQAISKKQHGVYKVNAVTGSCTPVDYKENLTSYFAL